MDDWTEGIYGLGKTSLECYVEGARLRELPVEIHLRHNSGFWGMV